MAIRDLRHIMQKGQGVAVALTTAPARTSSKGRKYRPTDIDFNRWDAADDLVRNVPSMLDISAPVLAVIQLLSTFCLGNCATRWYDMFSAYLAVTLHMAPYTCSTCSGFLLAQTPYRVRDVPYEVPHRASYHIAISLSPPSALVQLLVHRLSLYRLSRGFVSIDQAAQTHQLARQVKPTARFCKKDNPSWTNQQNPVGTYCTVHTYSS